jgi:hypothetical protein
MPVVASASVVVTAGGDSAIRQLNDVRRIIPMCFVPGAHWENPSSTAFPGQRTIDSEAMVPNPTIQLLQRTRCGRAVAGIGSGGLVVMCGMASQLLQKIDRDDLHGASRIWANL